ncbi:MAG TPA: Rieske 2Fe-2S domain-containing protein [Nitrospiria bacterium]|nr:Rieske 2Fe-2S domain-containing protein [Nitrospiria bacterium]
MTPPIFPLTDDGYVAAALVEELPAGEARMVRLTDRSGEDRLIALYNVAGTVYATDNSCPHSGGPLGKGTLRGEMITCPWHMWSFNVRTGQCDINDEERIEIYPVRIQDGRILVKL